MWRGFFVSCKYSVNCWSESFRPNQVFHQKRNGIRQISQAVRKKRSFWVRDMPGLRAAGRGVSIFISIPERLLDMLAEATRTKDIKRLPSDRILVDEPKCMPTAVEADVPVIAHNEVFAVPHCNRPEVDHPVRGIPWGVWDMGVNDLL